MRRLYLIIFIVLASAFQTYATISKDSSTWTATTIASNQTIEFDANSPAEIQLKGTISISAGCTLTIRNNSGKTIKITRTSNSVMFSSTGSLIIQGSEGSNIILDGGADYSFSEDDYSLTAGKSRTGRSISSTGYLNLEYVTIQNCNNYTSDGGAIHLSTSRQTILDHCLIQKCTAWRGSAIVISANNADPEVCAVKIQNSTITQCVTGGYSHSSQNNPGGAIRTFAGVSSNLYLTNVTMSWNYSRREEEEFVDSPVDLFHDGNGGALFWNGRKKEATTCYIDGCTFEYNKCDDNGGAIKAQGSIVFRNNTTTIRYNTAPLGAGMYIEGYTGTDATNIVANLTYDLNEYLKITDNYTVSFTEYTGETAPGKGAGIYFDFGPKMTLKKWSEITVNLNGAQINNNHSDQQGGLGGGIYYEENSDPSKKYTFNIYLNNGEVKGNTASADGGGIYVSKGDVTYKDGEEQSIVVSGNTAPNGAGIYIKDGNLHMANGKITGNIINGIGNGGGIYIENGDFTIESGEVSGNTLTSGQGAGVYIVGSGGKGNFTMNGGEIKENVTSGNDGGGVYINGGNFTLNRGSITGNSATEGGGVYLNNGNFSLVTGEISGNIASGNGGGVYLVGEDCEYRLKNGSITGNEAENGGGVYLANGSFILADNRNDTGSISENSASESGGGIYIAGEGDFTMNGGTVMRNSSTGNNGGGIFLNGGNFTLNYGNISSNTSEQMGGGVYLYGGTFLMQDGNIAGNSSASEGGGVCIVNNGNFTMNNGNITGNGKNSDGGVVTQNGGGVYLDGGTLTVAAGTISSNASTINGGGLYIMNGAVRMGAGIIQGNICGEYGGGVYVFNSSAVDQKTVDFNGGTLSGNSAKYGGGVCVNGLILMTIGNVEIAENTATNGGGVCLMNSAHMVFGRGQIKNNTAFTQRAFRTGYQKEIDEIEGFGGGVYLSTNTTLVFNYANDLGLFGNLADNGGDEIFANGKSTTVDLPDVTYMALGGYPGASNLKWIEDYPTNDGYYDKGTKLKGDAWDTDRTNLRYRETITVNAPIFNLSGATTQDTRYICFSLGYEVIYISVTRYGLGKGESAIYRLHKNEANDFMIILTGDGSEAVTKKAAVTAGEWTVSETDWSWGWTLTDADGNPIQDNSITKDIADDANRIFIFKGTRQTGIPMNSEDVEINTMGI